MTRICLALLFGVLAACDSRKIDLDDDDDDQDVEDAEDVATICAENEPEVITLTVSFPEPEPGCAWGEGGNLEAENGYFQARLEQSDSLDLPEDVVICDVAFDFASINGGEGTPMVYDDNFLFMFNDIVLASSYAPLLDVLPQDGIYATYDWDAIAGTELVFDNDIPTYCLGEADGLAACDIPPPETRGLMSLAFEDDIVNELGFSAVDQGRYDFMFVTMGDNDQTDCAHETFEFEVEIPYVEL